MSFQLGRKIYEATHRLKVDDKRPAGTPVHLLGSRKEDNGKWSCMVVCPILNKESQSYSFVCSWEVLEKLPFSGR